MGGAAGNEEKKQFLWGYRDSVRRIKRIESEIEELRAMRMGVSARNGVGRKGWKSDLSGYAARLDDLEGDLEDERESRIQAYGQIKKVIDSLDEAREQDVLFYRYIKGLSWPEIGERIGYDERHARRIHGWALSHLQI